MSEFNLYEVETKFGNCRDIIDTRLVDLKDYERLRHLYFEINPQIVFHAAAYKHLPFVERNPQAGITNNILTLKNAVLLANEFGIDKFVFISSDKAVLPSNVMGATKRIGELYVKAQRGRNKTKYCTVRFGNVIGSSGSLVPKVISSIQSGKSIELTDPAMTRYFMSLPEAGSLILQGCILAQGGEIFVLDMGEPVKIIDLIGEICLLHGKVLGRDLPLKIVGVRPGEKLHEELVNPGETLKEVADGIFEVESPSFDLSRIEICVDRILASATLNDTHAALEGIKALIQETGS